MTKKQMRMRSDLYDDRRIFDEISRFEQQFLFSIRYHGKRDKLSAKQAAKLEQIWNNVIGWS